MATGEVKFSGIDHPAIACNDVRALCDWYCRHLGMRVIVDNGHEPPTYLVGYDTAIGGGCVIELMSVKDDGPSPETFKRWQPGIRHLALRVADFDAAHAALKAAGATFIMEPAEAIGGGKVASFRDPEGNELQIIERK